MRLHFDYIAVRDSAEKILQLLGRIFGIESVQHVVFDHYLKIKWHIHTCHGSCRSVSLFLELIRLGIHFSNEHVDVTENVRIDHG